MMASSPDRRPVESSDGDSFDGCNEDDDDVKVKMNSTSHVIASGDGELEKKKSVDDNDVEHHDDDDNNKNSGVIGGDGDGDPESLRRRYRLPIVVMILVNFLDNINFAIVIPSLYPYVAKLGGSRTFYGWCISVYSLCQFISAPTLGWLSNYRPYREILSTCLTLEIVSSVIYSLAPNRWGILLARILVGTSAGAVAITRSYISGATTPTERTKYMSYVMMAQVLGFVFGPALGAGLSKIPVIVISRQEPRIVIDQYTIVGYISATLGLICIAMLALFFKELPRKSDNKNKRRRRRNTRRSGGQQQTWTVSAAGSSIQNTLQQHDTQETQGLLAGQSRIDYMTDSPTPEPGKPPFAVDEVESEYPVVEYESVASVVSSDPVDQEAAGSVHQESHSMPSVKDNRSLAIRLISIVSCLVVYFVSVSTFTVFESITTPLTEKFYGFEVWHNGLLFVGASFVSIGGFIACGFASRYIPDKWLLIVSTVFMTVGFGVLVDWNKDLWFWRFIVGAFIISFVLPTSQAIVTSLFSKMIEERQQGVMMGYMTSTASLARILGPLYATFIFDQIGAYAVFLMITVLTAITTLFQIVTYSCVRIHPEQELSIKLEAEKKKRNQKMKADDISAAQKTGEKQHLLPPERKDSTVDTGSINHPAGPDYYAR